MNEFMITRYIWDSTKPADVASFPLVRYQVPLWKAFILVFYNFRSITTVFWNTLLKRSNFLTNSLPSDDFWVQESRRNVGRVKWKCGQKERIFALAVLNVSIWVFSPSFRNANVRIQFFNSAMDVDVPWRIFHLMTSMIC